MGGPAIARSRRRPEAVYRQGLAGGPDAKQMEILEKRIHKIIARVSDVADFRRIAADALRGDTNVIVSGLSGSARALFIAGLWQSLRRPLIVVTAQDLGVEPLATDVAYFHGELNANGANRVSPFPAWETDPYAGLTPHADILQARATTLWRMRAKRMDIVVASIRSLATRLAPPAQFDTYSLHITVGDDLSQDLLMEHLSSAGYLRQEPVGAPGEFSMRGGIIDILAPLMRNPVRIEFFGDSVDSIREFDLDDQRSRGPVQHIDILPMQDLMISREMLRDWGGRARQRWSDDRFEKDLNEKLVFADNSELFPGAFCLMPIVQPIDSTLPDYADAAVLVLDEPEILEETHQRFFSALEQRFEQTQSAGGVALPPGEIFVSPDDLRSITSRHRRVSLEELGASGSSFFVKGQPIERFHGRVKDMAEVVRQSHGAGREVVLLGSTVGMAERLRDILHEYGIPFRSEFGEQPLKATDDSLAPIVGIGKISAGLRLPDAGLEIYAETDIFDESEHLPQQYRRRQKISSFLSDLQDLKPGDYVVHIDHGIGTYHGLTLVHEKECMVLLYQGGDRLYVPLERLDLVQKYSSTEGAKPQLDKLGGTTWIARKTRAKRAIRDMAQELLKLYAERKLATGYACSPDTEWQKEFEEAFQYEETPDQLSAVETFKERFAAFPVTIAMLSRFVPPKEQKKIIVAAEAGKTDIVIGTHRLLSKDIKFHDLALMIVDEEQRFGVAHKERLKHIKKQVDVVTMTATPIPRTLNMALSGLRDMSVIETAPRDRLAIQTVVVKFKSVVIENAIRFELERGGQVYVVHNRVESIYSLANFIRRICPNARLGVAHGQMGEKELEQVMTRFMHHEFDVLVATTIIENGLDIPLANTLIVNRADRYGLSQLYQLRGRVGRSNRRAYAYLLIPSDETLTPIARRRLAAIREFSELGAGFRIAALDLELRGAGNLLGGQQHGHIEAIGFDLYCQLLERTIEELRSGEVQPEVETAINLKVDLKIPADFVEEEVQRLRLYKQIASSRTEAEIDSLYRDLEDRFGELPLPVRNLLEYARLRILGRARGVTSIERTVQGIDIKFHETARIDPERIVELVGSGNGLTFAPPATLRLKAGPSRAGLFSSIENILREIA